MTDQTEREPSKEQRHIQSIEVGFRLIAVLEGSKVKLPLKVIAERAGMPASKAHLYMVSFTRLGLVTQDPVSTRYGLGPYAVQLGLAGLRQLDVLDIARGSAEDLQQRCGLSVFLSVWGNMGPTIVAKFDGDLEVPVAIRVGHVLPLLTSATGRVFLASLPRSLLDDVLLRSGSDVRNLPRVTEEAAAELASDGVTRSDSRVFDGFAALSSPIRDTAGAVAATLTLLGLRSRVDLDPHGALAADLRTTCAEVSRIMGYGGEGDRRDDEEAPKGDAGKSLSGGRFPKSKAPTASRKGRTKAAQA
jgi:DNA-binding IclR family transcriptional regulator